MIGLMQLNWTILNKTSAQQNRFNWQINFLAVAAGVSFNDVWTDFTAEQCLAGRLCTAASEHSIIWQSSSLIGHTGVLVNCPLCIFPGQVKLKGVFHLLLCICGLHLKTLLYVNSSSSRMTLQSMQPPSALVWFFGFVVSWRIFNWHWGVQDSPGCTEVNVARVCLERITSHGCYTCMFFKYSIGRFFCHCFKHALQQLDQLV